MMTGDCFPNHADQDYDSPTISIWFVPCLCDYCVHFLDEHSIKFKNLPLWCLRNGCWKIKTLKTLTLMRPPSSIGILVTRHVCHELIHFSCDAWVVWDQRAVAAGDWWWWSPANQQIQQNTGQIVGQTVWHTQKMVLRLNKQMFERNWTCTSVC